METIEWLSLEDAPIFQSSRKFKPLKRILGRVRLSGEVIWADDFKLTGQSKKNDHYGTGFTVSFAIALCEGEVSHISKIWANQEILDLTMINWRLHQGAQIQAPDPLIETSFEDGQAPAFDGVAYVVFEDLPLDQFANMVPKFEFEVVRATGKLERQIKAVSLIPGATEFGYHTISIRTQKDGEFTSDNHHGFMGETDFVTSIEELVSLCPNLTQVALIVPWYGDDLRASHIKILPKVEDANKSTKPEKWLVSEFRRTQTLEVSKVDGRAAYGGTPSDASILAAIKKIKALGLKLIFYPFLMMDIKKNSTLPNPEGGTQKAYPWRGHISIHPAIGQEGSVDQSAKAKSQVKRFFGNAAWDQFHTRGEQIYFDGQTDFGWRRPVLHYAHLCKLAGGIDTFLLGSEFVALNRARDEDGKFIATHEWRNLAEQVKHILPNTKVSYGADWSEYFGYKPKDSNDFYFHLDELWGDPNIDFVAIDAYWPLSDVKDESELLEQGQLIYDQDYLTSQIRSGEGFDYYYKSAADRVTNHRIAIEDGAYQKPWVYRFKDLKNWWLNDHYDRVNGVEKGNKTAWIPESKPIFLSEIGCPAVDKGSNQPNVFYDQISSDAALPHHASLKRDDVIQRQYLTSLIEYYQKSHEHNPISNLCHKPMIEDENMVAWAYDARPYPMFPLLTDVWADGENWHYGHWLNGRLGSVCLSDLIKALINEQVKVDVSQIYGQVEGYVIDFAESPATSLRKIMQLYDLYAFEHSDVLIFRHQQLRKSRRLKQTNIIHMPDMSVSHQKINGISDAMVHHISDDGSYSISTASFAKNLDVDADRKLKQINFPAVMPSKRAAKFAQNLVEHELVLSDKMQFYYWDVETHFEIGDVIYFGEVEPYKYWQITKLKHDQYWRIDVKKTEIDRAQAINDQAPKEGILYQKQVALGVDIDVLDLPNWRLDEKPTSVDIVAKMKPWHGQKQILSQEGGGFVKRLDIGAPTEYGYTENEMPKAILHQMDRRAKLRVKMQVGELFSIDETQVMNGGNLALIKDRDRWEILQFQKAELIDHQTYHLSNFIRGKFGNQTDCLLPFSAGSEFILLNQKIPQLDLRDHEALAEFELSYGAQNAPIESDLYQKQSFQHQAVALKPYAPVHARCNRIQSGVHLSWIRQDRQHAERWDYAEILMSEQIESYEIEILEIGSNEVVRMLQSDQPNIFYSNKMMNSDLGKNVRRFKYHIYQMSNRVGRGYALKGEYHG